MVKYDKCNCGEEVSLEEVKSKLVDMLLVLADYCEKNGIRYYLSGGTLLGAIRHKGFIPWDDDIDINMPRPDCEKLQKISGGVIGNYKLVRPSGNALCVKHFWRLYDESVLLEDSIQKNNKKNVYYPIFIDIFPIEGLPADDKATKKHYNSMELGKKMLNCTTGSLFHGKNLPAKIFHFVCRPIAMLFGQDYWVQQVQKKATSIPFNDSEYIGVVTTNIHKTEEKVLKAEYIPQIELEFEGHMLKGPKGYHKYLSQLYGDDYMELPPEEKRVSHHIFKFYKTIQSEKSNI